MLDREVKILENISIRGRMSLAINILQKITKHFDYNNDSYEELLALLKLFTKSNSLDDWEEEIMKYMPNSQNYYSIDCSEKPVGVHSWYCVISPKVLSIIKSTILIGVSNLYSDTGIKSQITLDNLMEVINEADNLGISVPDISVYCKYSFLENFGWGLPFEYEKIE